MNKKPKFCQDTQAIICNLELKEGFEEKPKFCWDTQTIIYNLEIKEDFEEEEM